MCDCENNCLNSLLHRLSRLSDNEVSWNRQHASPYGMLPAIICSARRWMFSSECFPPSLHPVSLVAARGSGERYSSPSVSARPPNAFLCNSQPKICKSVKSFTHMHNTPIHSLSWECCKHSSVWYPDVLILTVTGTRGPPWLCPLCPPHCCATAKQSSLLFPYSLVMNSGC